MDKLKKIILLQVPVTICNFRCSYCYLGARPEREKDKDKQINYSYSPQHVRKALSKERMGGCCFINICAAGETLLAKDITKYLYELLDEGHYCEFVSNMSVTKVLDEICSWDKRLLSHLEFKCSMHYMELKKNNLLDVFADNVNKCWNAGASITVEVTPHDELIPYIDEMKAFCIEKFGALPHITIARDDSVKNITKLTVLSEEEYKKIWGQFDSEFWTFKQKIFGKKRTEFCYAGDWLIDVDLATGYTTQCYCTKFSQNIFESVDKKIKFLPYGNNCAQPHCFNGHAMLTLGCIPDFASPTYASVRDRIRNDGTYWLQKDFYDFISQKLESNNQKHSHLLQKANDVRILCHKIHNKLQKNIRPLCQQSKRIK